MTKRVNVDTSGFQLYPEIVGDDEEETALLQEAADRVLRLTRPVRGSPPVKHLYLAWGIGGLICLFLLEYEWRFDEREGDLYWTVIGDVPVAYLPIQADFYPEGETLSDPRDGLEFYCNAMENWADTVLEGGDLSGCYPVSAAPTEEHARMLKSRIEFIREKLMPDFADFIGGVNRSPEGLDEQA